jgi:hypothetical protein
VWAGLGDQSGVQGTGVGLLFVEDFPPRAVHVCRRCVISGHWKAADVSMFRRASALVGVTSQGQLFCPTHGCRLRSCGEYAPVFNHSLPLHHGFAAIGASARRLVGSMGVLPQWICQRGRQTCLKRSEFAQTCLGTGQKISRERRHKDCS